MHDPRTLITARMIAQDLALLTRARRIQVVLAYFVCDDTFRWRVWIDGYAYQPAPLSSEDLKLSLNDFQAKNLDGFKERWPGVAQPPFELPHNGENWAEVWTPREISHV